MIKSLKQEYEMRYRIMRYKKLHRKILYTFIEKNNVRLLFDALINVADFVKIV